MKHLAFPAALALVPFSLSPSAISVLSLSRGSGQALSKGRLNRTQAPKKPALRRGALSALLAMALSGCMNLAPSYSTPPVPVPATVGADAPATPAQPTALALEQAQAIGWVQTSALQQVLALALAHNRDLKIALANIDKARAQYGMQRADALPT
ncbi:MAG: TolC family protein, partial [Rhodoferax sp.]|nr:TolC family protein [Rhodoferax sp.]